MQASDYILHVRDGHLGKVPVENIRLSRDPQEHTQRLCMAQSPDGSLYATQHTLLHKSSDRGRTWTHLPRDPTVYASHDDGLHWTAIGQIDISAEEVMSLGFNMTRLADETLLVPILVGADRIGDGKQAAKRPALVGSIDQRTEGEPSRTIRCWETGVVRSMWRKCHRGNC